MLNHASQSNTQKKIVIAAHILLNPISDPPLDHITMVISLFQRTLALVLCLSGSVYSYSHHSQMCRVKSFDQSRRIDWSSSRRQWISWVASTAFLSVPSAANAASYTTYDDPIHGFRIDVPSGWAQSTQQLPDRRKIQLWTDPGDTSALLFIAYTPVRDDFTSLSSFGSVDQVAAQTILPKGQIAGVDVKSEMLSSFSKNQAYFFDYTQEVPNVQPSTHIRTIFALQQGATGGAGAVLVTVTAQALESKYGAVKGQFDHIIESYGTSAA